MRNRGLPAVACSLIARPTVAGGRFAFQQNAGAAPPWGQNVQAIFILKSLWRVAQAIDNEKQ
jgi:hypothetical protein